MLKKIIRNTINYLTLNKLHKSIERTFKKDMTINGIMNTKVDGEDEWMKKWSVFGMNLQRTQFRLFSHYIGPDINIVPEEICHAYIEPILNPILYRYYYADKNAFDKVLPLGSCPTTFMRRINGYYYDKDYQAINNTTNHTLSDILSHATCNKIVIKPSAGSNSGKGVLIYKRDDAGNWISNNTRLAIDVLDALGKDFIVQEAIQQNDYLNQFNPTSINTLRLTTYRSVKDNKVHILRAFLRIGSKGKIVDNAHAGGSFVGINLDGSFCHNVVNQYGQKQNIFNGVNFEQDFTYPNWDKVIEFAKQIANAVIHHRLLALDIALNAKGDPVLVEYNLMTFAPWANQFTTGPALGEFTDEIIEYCLAKKNTIKRYHTF